ncbi:UDP-4-amino-4,6-dideoxy-N-acetyl-beta-L-altrosamine transaminase [Bacillus sp. SM2101]|uniref:UDP-4-amino-4, 6-dideoxy-N-acetyl-beta-L-altrosamine transaminase n=1 Tax=Bacillus sp. SM2101 TaxID=2805366 RepID=UPI001BDED8AF|nr:UDP-4-amino-4,6-dideoxy-N-acetyl-beta-L-altrosamine transaminase [Bacillus sp. SM2101]
MLNKLAIHGGKPVRNEFLPYGQQWIDDQDINIVIDVLKSKYLTTGPLLEKFEKEISTYVNSKYAVAFSSGTAALHAAVFAAGISEGDEVITTPITFVATPNCVLYQRGSPIFADINLDTNNIAAENIEALITSRTKAIIPVDFGGQPVDLDDIMSIARKHDLIIIEDAAHALGAKYKGRQIGSISDMTMFSFHPVKHITTGEGGVITTNNPNYYDKLIQFRNHGITRNCEKMGENEGAWYYEMQFLGFNYRMTDIQAALGISQLKKVDSFISRRKAIVRKYNSAFDKLNQLTLPYEKNDRLSSYHLYVIKLDLHKLNGARKEIYEALINENIGVNVHYIPVYLQPYYQQLGYPRSLCPVAEKFYGDAITLPLFPKMTDEDVESVIKAVQKVIFYFAK